MSEIKSWYLVSYDVRDPKRWRKTVKKLKSYGKRIQLSVFRCRLSEREVERMKWELAKVLKEEDSLLVVGLCDNCVARFNRQMSTEKEWPEEQSTFEVV